jgi:hypothetical protein
VEDIAANLGWFNKILVDFGGQWFNFSSHPVSGPAGSYYKIINYGRKETENFVV